MIAVHERWQSFTIPCREVPPLGYDEDSDPFFTPEEKMIDCNLYLMGQATGDRK